MKCKKCGAEISFLGVCEKCIQEDLKNKPFDWDGNKMTIRNEEENNKKKPNEEKST